MESIKLILVDDHEIFLAGLKLKLSQRQQFVNVIAEAHDFKTLMLHLETGLVPDIIILDYHLPGENGINVALNIRKVQQFSKIKIIMLSAYSSHFLDAHNYDLIREAIDAGIDGYLLKDSEIDEIVNAVIKVYEGQKFVLGETIDVYEINKEIIEDRRSIMRLLKKQNNFGLTQKEIEILQLLTMGNSAKSVAGIMKISEEAVTNHKDNIKFKLREKYGLEFKNVVELIVWAIKNKVVKV